MSAPLLGHGPRSDLETETFALAVGALTGHKDRGGWRAGPDEAAAGHVIAVDMQNAGTGELSGTLQAEAQRRGNRGYGVLAHALRSEGADASEDGTGRGTPLVAVAETLDVGYAKTTDSAGSNGAGPRNVVIGALRSNHHNNSDPTTEAAMHIQQGLSVRRLTPVECERLQGFPDGWTAGESDSARYRTLGNAVCVPVVEWIARRLVAVESLR